MATQTKAPASDKEQNLPSEVAHTAKTDVKTFQAFFTKFNNDWVMNFAAGLAFNILTAIFPIVIAIISIAGFVAGALDPGAQAQLINGISSTFPNNISAQEALKPALASLSKNAGPLGIIAILLAIFGGSRLFVTLEGYFDIIYHTGPRDVLKQNIMAIVMMLVFIVLVPIMVFGALGPAFVFSMLQQTPLGKVPGSGLLFGLGGILVALAFAWVFFVIIYIVVPNQHISLRNSWLGALVAAVALQLYLILFPLYVTHFLNSYTGAAGAAGFAVILLIFFYYFAVILLLGAEVNAFFAEGVRATPDSLPVMVHQVTSHVATSKQANAKTAASTAAEPGQLEPAQTDHLETKKQKGASPPRSSRVLAIVEAVVGTALAFLIEFFQLRRKK